MTLANRLITFTNMGKLDGQVAFITGAAVLANAGIRRVNCIAPTAVRTPMAANVSIAALFEVNPALARAMSNSLPVDAGSLNRR